MSEIEQETPSPKQKAPGNPKRVQITQATPTSRPPQPAPLTLEASGTDGTTGNSNRNPNSNPKH